MGYPPYDWQPDPMDPRYVPPQSPQGPLPFDPTQALMPERPNARGMDGGRFSGFLDDFAYSLGSHPMQAPQNFGGGLMAGLAQGFATSRLRKMQEQQKQQQSEKDFAAKRNEANLKATEAARALRLHALQQKAARAGAVADQLAVYTGEQDYDRTHKTGKFKPDTPAAGAGQKPADLNDYTSLLARIEADKDVTTFRTVRDSYSVMQSAGDNAAGDMKLVYSYMKLLDPGSAVREGEYATAEQTRGIPEAVRNAYNKAWEGRRLSADQRQRFVGEAQSAYRSRLPQYKSAMARYHALAKKFGVDPSIIVQDYQVPDPDMPNTPTPPNTNPRVGLAEFER